MIAFMPWMHLVHARFDAVLCKYVKGIYNRNVPVRFVYIRDDRSWAKEPLTYIQPVESLLKLCILPYSIWKSPWFSQKGYNSVAFYSNCLRNSDGIPIEVKPHEAEESCRSEFFFCRLWSPTDIIPVVCLKVGKHSQLYSKSTRDVHVLTTSNEDSVVKSDAPNHVSWTMITFFNSVCTPSILIAKSSRSGLSCSLQWYLSAISSTQTQSVSINM